MIRILPPRYLLAIALILVACTRTAIRNLSMEELNVKPRVKQLINSQPSYFDSPYTLVVILDRQACGGNLVETRWWPEWQQLMKDNGCEFVFATSKRDSSEMATALQFENLVAPILVLPGSEQYVWDQDSPVRSMTLKLLVDSSARVRRGWLSVVDAETSEQMIAAIDSLVGGYK